MAELTRFAGATMVAALNVTQRSSLALRRRGLLSLQTTSPSELHELHESGALLVHLYNCAFKMSIFQTANALFTVRDMGKVGRITMIPYRPGKKNGYPRSTVASAEKIVQWLEGIKPDII